MTCLAQPKCALTVTRSCVAKATLIATPPLCKGPDFVGTGRVGGVECHPLLPPPYPPLQRRGAASRACERETDSPPQRSTASSPGNRRSPDAPPPADRRSGSPLGREEPPVIPTPA